MSLHYLANCLPCSRNEWSELPLLHKTQPFKIAAEKYLFSDAGIIWFTDENIFTAATPTSDCSPAGCSYQEERRCTKTPVVHIKSQVTNNTPVWYWSTRVKFSEGYYLNVTTVPIRQFSDEFIFQQDSKQTHWVFESIDFLLCWLTLKIFSKWSQHFHKWILPNCNNGIRKLIDYCG